MSALAKNLTDEHVEIIERTYAFYKERGDEASCEAIRKEYPQLFKKKYKATWWAYRYREDDFVDFDDIIEAYDEVDAYEQVIKRDMAIKRGSIELKEIK